MRRFTFGAILNDRSPTRQREKLAMANVTLVTRNFPPSTGGQERLLRRAYVQMTGEHRVTLIGPKGCKAFIDTNADVVETPISCTPIFLVLSFVKAVLLHLSTRRPDVVIGGSGLVAPIAIMLAWLTRARSIVLLHGLDIVVDARLYQLLFVPFFKHANLIVCNSENTARLAVERGVRPKQIDIINPGVDLPGTSMSQDEAKKRLGFEGKTLLLSVGRLIPRKGLAEFIDKCFAALAAEDANLVLLIAGSEPKGALNMRGQSVLTDIEAAIDARGLRDQVRLLGHLSDHEVESLYAGADVFVFPLVETHGDVEGFGMVVIEAASFGTPTVAFDCGGVGDTIAAGVNGYLVPPENYAEFGAAVMRLLGENLRSSSRAFARGFSWDSYYRKLKASIERALM